MDMKLKNISQLFAVSLSLVCSSMTFAGGGGSDDTGNNSFPSRDTCTQNCGFETGPNPTLNFLRASSGPQTTATISVSRDVDGFGGGTIYYPTSISEKMATIAIAPGFTNRASRVAWWGKMLASHGFIAFVIDTNSVYDQPASRSRQLDTALSYLIQQSRNASSVISGLVDEGRLATMGYSMGGGGALASAARHPLSAALPFSPYSTGSNEFNRITAPTMIIGCQEDGTAPVASHAIPFYNRIPNTTDKAYLEFANGSHGCGTGDDSSDTALLSTYGVSWMKRFLDKDRRYNPFLCGPDHTANQKISDYRDNCGY